MIVDFFDFEMIPNPDWERILIELDLGQDNVYQVVVDTTSSPVPLPPAVLLFGSALAGVVLLRRRRTEG